MTSDVRQKLLVYLLLHPDGGCLPTDTAQLLDVICRAYLASPQHTRGRKKPRGKDVRCLLVSAQYGGSPGVAEQDMSHLMRRRKTSPGGRTHGVKSYVRDTVSVKAHTIPLVTRRHRS